MEYLVVSFTYKNTSINIREKLAFSNDLEKEIFLDTTIQASSINESILVSTCNRVEFILSVSCPNEASSHITNLLSQKTKIPKITLDDMADFYHNEDAIHHIFTVVSSLDSLVVGETQISGQVKDAFRLSLQKHFCNNKLSRVLNYAFKCAAKVRTATSLGIGSVSVASTAVSKIKELYKDKNGISVVVIGAGEMSQIAIKHLIKADFKVIICSRNMQKAKVLKSSLNDTNITVEPYDKLKELLNSKRVILTATSAPYPIITTDLIEDFNETRDWFDIAVPRDIQDMDIPKINIYSVDDLQGIVDENITLRNGAAKIAYGIVKDTTKEFYIWEKSLNIEPTIKKIYKIANNSIDKKINNAIKKSYIKIEDKENIYKLCQTIINDFLHTSITNLRDISTTIECDDTLNVVSKIFGLEDN